MMVDYKTYNIYDYGILYFRSLISPSGIIMNYQLLSIVTGHLKTLYYVARRLHVFYAKYLSKKNKNQ